MIDRDGDVVVVGAGIVGSATAYYLALNSLRQVPFFLIADGKTSLEISGFRFSRFAEGAVGQPKNVL